MDANQLLVGELLNAHVAQFAPVSGVLDATKWQFRFCPVDIVDEHHANVDAAGNTLAARDILGPHRAAETEVGIIGQGNGFVFILRLQILPRASVCAYASHVMPRG